MKLKVISNEDFPGTCDICKIKTLVIVRHTFIVRETKSGVEKIKQRLCENCDSTSIVSIKPHPPKKLS